MIYRLDLEVVALRNVMQSVVTARDRSDGRRSRRCPMSQVKGGGAMFMGRYDFEGDPSLLVAAYDRLLEALGDEGIAFHACVVRESGISMYDCCPSEEVFAKFSTSSYLADATSTAGLPPPTVTRLGDVHAARTAAGPVP